MHSRNSEEPVQTLGSEKFDSRNTCWVPLDCYQDQLSSLEARNLRRGFSNHS
jgi:hypothetical protein